MFEKISSIINDRNLKAADCKYHTLRALENNGRIRVLAVKGDEKATVEYICPKCGHYGTEEKPWSRPFSVKCSKCDATIKVPKLKGKKNKKKKTKKK